MPTLSEGAWRTLLELHRVSDSSKNTMHTNTGSAYFSMLMELVNGGLAHLVADNYHGGVTYYRVCISDDGKAYVRQKGA